VGSLAPGGELVSVRGAKTALARYPIPGSSRVAHGVWKFCVTV